MDTPTYTPNPSGAVPPPPASRPRSDMMLIAFGAICILIAAAILGLFYFWHGASRTSSFAVAIGPVPASRLYYVDQGNDVVPYTVSFEGHALAVLDTASAADGTRYYILSEPSEGFVSNVYVESAAGTVRKLTNSPTAKFNLSINAETHMLAYQAATMSNLSDFFSTYEWNLTVASADTGSERIVARGVNPAFTQNGQALLYVDRSLQLHRQLLAVPAATSTILAKIPGIPYVISPDGTRLAAVNMVTHDIDTYRVVNSLSLSYDSSIHASTMPQALGFVRGDLIAARLRQTADAAHLDFYNLTASTTMSAAVATSSTAQQVQRIYAYEK